MKQENRTRQYRRAQERRLMVRARRIVDGWCSPNFGTDSLTNSEKHIGARRIVNNRKSCSCSMCGNQRNNGWGGTVDCLTKPEMRHLENLDDWLSYGSDLEKDSINEFI